MKCPFCAEEIKDEAIKCPFCKKFLEKTSRKPKKSPAVLDILLVVVAAFLLLGVFNLYKEDIIKSVHRLAPQARENELAFQKEKEETRKAEFNRLLRIHEEEKREEKRAEERRREEESYKEAVKLLEEEQERQDRLMAALVLQYIQLRSAGNRLPEPVSSPEVIPSISPLNTVVKARITNDFDGLKQGNIYKLDNGQIWEQTDFYIYTRIAITPSVIIWRDGAGYKMIVDGIDKAVSVQQVK